MDHSLFRFLLRTDLPKRELLNMRRDMPLDEYFEIANEKQTEATI